MKFLLSALVISVIGMTLATMSFSSGSNSSESPSKNDTLANLRKLASSDPGKDFAAARANRDFRLLAMMGYAMTVPGVPDYKQKYSELVGVKLIRGTTDAITSSEQRRLQDAVQNYAEKYNKLVVNYLSTHNAKHGRSK